MKGTQIPQDPYIGTPKKTMLPRAIAGMGFGSKALDPLLIGTPLDLHGRCVVGGS